MAKKISGITVAIDCDTTGVTKGLKDINDKVIKTQSELKQLNNALKLNPKNVDLVKEKQKALAEQIEQTKEKLKVLESAQKDVTEAFKKGDINREEYVKFQEELEKTRNQLEKLKDQAIETATQGFDRLGTSMKNAGEKVTDVGKNIAPISATVATIGLAGLKVATDFEAGMSQVKAITGATGEEFDKLKDKAIELGASTSFSSEEVAEAMSEMAKAGWTTDQIIDGLGGVLSATSASGEQLGSVATIVADAITGFGLKAEDSQRIADLLTQSANSGTIGITDLGESFKYIAPLAKSLNLSVEDVTTAISAMSMSGIKGSSAGTALRTTLTNLVKPTDEMQKAMDELGIEVTNSDGSFKSLDEILAIMRTSFSGLTEDQQAYYASTLAGKEGMSGLLSMLNMTQEEYDALGASMDNAKGIADETASVMQDNLQAKVEQLGGSLESLAIKLADNVLPFITDMVEKITGLVDKFTNMDEGTQKFILAIAGIVMIASPVLMFIGKMITAFGAIFSAVGPVISIIAKVGTFIGGLMNPVTLIIAGIMALVGVLIYLWNNCEWFRDGVIKIFTWMKDTLIGMWESLKKAWSDFWAYLSTVGTELLNSIVDFVVNTFNGFVDTIKGIGSALYSAGAFIFTSLWNGIKSIWTSITTFFTVTIPNMFKSISSINLLQIGKDILTSLWNGLKEVWTSISSWFGEKVQWISDKLSWIFSKKEEADKESKGIDGSHANGLAYVPYDNYIAQLHKGERVLTAQENREYSQGSSGGGLSVVQNIYVPTENPRELERQAKRQLVKLGLG